MKLKSFLNQLNGDIFVHITDKDGCRRYIQVSDYKRGDEAELATVKPLLDKAIKPDVDVYIQTNPKTLSGKVAVLYITMAERKEV